MDNAVPALNDPAGDLRSAIQDMTISELQGLVSDAREVLRYKRHKASRLQADLEKAARSSGLDPREIELLFG